RSSFDDCNRCADTRVGLGSWLPYSSHVLPFLPHWPGTGSVCRPCRRSSFAAHSLLLGWTVPRLRSRRCTSFAGESLGYHDDVRCLVGMELLVRRPTMVARSPPEYDGFRYCSPSL